MIQQTEIDCLSEKILRLEKSLAEEKSTTETWRKRTNALLMISDATKDTLSGGQIYQRITDTIPKITGFNSVTISLRSRQENRYRIVAFRNLTPESISEMMGAQMMLDGGGFSDEIEQTLKPAYTSHMEEDPRYVRVNVKHTGHKSSAFFPLVTRDDLIGILTLHSQATVNWTADELQWLETVAQQCGVIIQHSQLAEQLKISATMTERARLSRELHDNLAQVLGLFNLKSQVTQTLLSSQETTKVMGELREMEELSAQAYADVRESITGLRMSSSMERELTETVEEYGREFGKRNNLQVNFDLSHWMHPPLTTETQVQVLRILQEAMTNVRRHAQADQMQITFTSGDRLATISVRDNGCGFSPAMINGNRFGHIGLQSMRERAESVGARLEVTSGPSVGTEVRIELPIDYNNYENR